MYKNFVFIGFLLFLVSCETTTPVAEKPKIILEPSEKIIYDPEERLSSEDAEEQAISEDEELIEIQDFTGIKNYQLKPLTSVIANYGEFDFSKKEKEFELHRYNIGKCRIFIQSNTLDKKIISITIFNIENKSTLNSYAKDLCH